MKLTKTNLRPAAVGALAASLLLSNPVAADPPVTPPIEGTVLPRVFCFRITDIRADKTDPELNKFHFEFEVLNWSDVDAGGLELALAEPTPADVVFCPNLFRGVDFDGRPLFPEDTDGDGEIDADDNEDDNGNGILDPGEDQNGNDRLDNDPIPGNLNFPSLWNLDTQTATRLVWSAPPLIPDVAVLGIRFVNLIGAAGVGALTGDPDFANCCVPGVEDGLATVDVDGNVTPTEAIDDEDNVQDGFVMTIDGLDPGETVSINWFLTSAGSFGEAFAPPQGFAPALPRFCRLSNRRDLPLGEPIGIGFEANDYGFGVINLSRVDDGPFPAPVFEGNVGVSQTGLEFFDSVYIVPDPAGMAMELGAGLTAAFVNPDDNTFGAPITAVPVPTVTDTDGDGVPDDLDECPESDLSPTIVIAGCDSGVENLLFENGCTLSDLVHACAEGARNHGHFVSCVASLANDLKKEGIITGKEKGKLVSCAAKSNSESESEGKGKGKK